MSDLLTVKGLCVDYVTAKGGHVRAVDNVSFSIKEGQSFGLAGESGCGKSTIAYSLMRLHRPPALISDGQIIFEGNDIVSMTEPQVQQLRWSKISMVFQSAMNSLNPVVTMEKQIYEIFKYHGVANDKNAYRKRAEELLSLVGIPAERLRDYPHQYSGGMRQRAVIAMALALNPKLLILDEPTTALDTVVQRDILQCIYDLKKELNFSILFITHDISLMMEFCDTIGIMYAGKIVEQASSEQVLHNPRHPYAYGLKNSFPSLKGEVKYMEGIPGTPLDLHKIPVGCRFQDRCFRTCGDCFTKEPVISTTNEGFFYCHNPLDVDSYKQNVV